MWCGGSGDETTRDLYAYHVAISMIAPSITPHPFLAKITIITNNYQDKPLKFGQTVTIAVGHERDCYVQFEFTCKQLYHIKNFFKINVGPKELGYE